MVDDIFAFSVKNPVDAIYNVVSGVVQKLAGTDPLALVEDGLVNYDYTPVAFVFQVQNAGEVDGVAVCNLKEGETVLESKNPLISAGATVAVTFLNDNAGFAIGEGVTVNYALEVGET